MEIKYDENSSPTKRVLPSGTYLMGTKRNETKERQQFDAMVKNKTFQVHVVG